MWQVKAAIPNPHTPLCVACGGGGRGEAAAVQVTAAQGVANHATPGWLLIFMAADWQAQWWWMIGEGGDGLSGDVPLCSRGLLPPGRRVVTLPNCLATWLCDAMPLCSLGPPTAPHPHNPPPHLAPCSCWRRATLGCTTWRRASRAGATPACLSTSRGSSDMQQVTKEAGMVWRVVRTCV